MLLFPQRVILTRFGRYTILGYASRSTSEARLDHAYDQQVCNTNRLNFIDLERFFYLHDLNN